MFYKRLSVFIALLCLVAFVLQGCGGIKSAHVGNVPTVTGYVTDLAEVLSDEDEAYLRELCVRLKNKTSAEFVIVTVKHMSADGISDDRFTYPSVEDYATELFRKNGFGNKEKNNGVLLLVSTGERKVRIEVGYGLEGILPDGKCGRILDKYPVPFLNNNQYNPGIRGAAAAIVKEIDGSLAVDVESDEVLDSKSVSEGSKPVSEVGGRAPVAKVDNRTVNTVSNGEQYNSMLLRLLNLVGPKAGFCGILVVIIVPVSILLTVFILLLFVYCFLLMLSGFPFVGSLVEICNFFLKVLFFALIIRLPVSTLFSGPSSGGGFGGGSSGGGGSSRGF